MTRELLIKVLRELLAWIEKQIWLPPEPPQPPPPPPTDKDVLLLKMLTGIKEHEDYVLPGGRYRNGELAPHGSLSYRNRNPGNVKFSPVGYLPKYGKVTSDARGFAVFEKYDLGWMYLRNLILEHAKRNPDWSLATYIRRTYAPPEDDNDSASYASALGQKMGINPYTWQLKNLL